MVDTITTTTGVFDVVATYDGAGKATGLAVRYLRTFNDLTTGHVDTVVKGPIPLPLTDYADVLTALLSAMPKESGQ
jgi:hypothetical protein